MEVIGVVPARLDSSRLPGKVMADIQGRPLLWHVCQRVQRARLVEKLFVATDAVKVRDAVDSWNISVLLTSSNHRSGTDRLAEALERLPGRFIVNIQGDEPLIDPDTIDAVIDRWQTTRADVVTPVYRIKETKVLMSPHVVKVVRGRESEALYFSRSAIPHLRDIAVDEWSSRHSFWGHVGVYGYRREVLAAFPTLPEGPLERAERLEQLRFLESGYRVETIETGYHPVAVDTPEDLERVRQLLRPA
jgi:3-deoxy-manno-octulosonate cytidylyltransferase (CMP-KDO synthetase)